MVVAIILLVCMTIICVVAASLIVVIVYIIFEFIYWRVVENDSGLEIESDLEEGVERRRRRYRQRKYCRVMMELPCVEYGSDGIETTSRECAICLEDYNGGEPCRIMPVCKHMFHVACIDNWLRVNITCPVCRQRIFNLRNHR
ncbi:unnamed protein product [Linum tenue]|uniref:RING-type domain-containing protein n=1 Tax=Linum tenue TaxID=586396 RepID=A0AAV0HRU1_9ROSI|nr:unnamed protein product [Linum tenue]